MNVVLSLFVRDPIFFRWSGLEPEIDHDAKWYQSSPEFFFYFFDRIFTSCTIKMLKSREDVLCWCTRDTRATCRNRRTAIKMEHFLKSPCFFLILMVLQCYLKMDPMKLFHVWEPPKTTSTTQWKIIYYKNIQNFSTGLYKRIKILSNRIQINSNFERSYFEISS